MCIQELLHNEYSKTKLKEWKISEHWAVVHFKIVWKCNDDWRESNSYSNLIDFYYYIYCIFAFRPTKIRNLNNLMACGAMYTITILYLQCATINLHIYKLRKAMEQQVCQNQISNIQECVWWETSLFEIFIAELFSAFIPNCHCVRLCDVRCVKRIR